MSVWLDHVKKTKKAHPSKSLKEVLIMASKTYKQGAKAGPKKAKTMKKKKKGKTMKKKQKKKGKTMRKKSM